MVYGNGFLRVNKEHIINIKMATCIWFDSRDGQLVVEFGDKQNVFGMDRDCFSQLQVWLLDGGETP